MKRTNVNGRFGIGRFTRAWCVCAKESGTDEIRGGRCRVYKCKTVIKHRGTIDCYSSKAATRQEGNERGLIKESRARIESTQTYEERRRRGGGDCAASRARSPCADRSSRFRCVLYRATIARIIHSRFVSKLRRDNAPVLPDSLSKALTVTRR